jgi:hypothetical protein
MVVNTGEADTVVPIAVSDPAGPDVAELPVLMANSETF